VISASLLLRERKHATTLREDGKERIDRLVAALLGKNKLTREEMEALLAS
jgi:ATP-dependent Zn protease